MPRSRLTRCTPQHIFRFRFRRVNKNQKYRKTNTRFVFSDKFYVEIHSLDNFSRLVNTLQQARKKIIYFGENTFFTNDAVTHTERWTVTAAMTVIDVICHHTPYLISASDFRNKMATGERWPVVPTLPVVGISTLRTSIFFSRSIVICKCSDVRMFGVCVCLCCLFQFFNLKWACTLVRHINLYHCLPLSV